MLSSLPTLTEFHRSGTPVLTTGLEEFMMENISVQPEPKIFEDMAVYFTEQELASLTLDQKAVYKDVVLENFTHMALLGYLAKVRQYVQMTAEAESSRVKAFL
ncbi:KRAB domain-containing protein 1 isoform X2 [Arvicola amphibius]|uniref:KRAB domain-containing protein 1 isoform X2 n=1 Tax=Arvicola amphibius TaxID=1047088 RepID=UPI0018E2BC3F|nr:KRAB domain-containing protein 1 isoform X2 [Arvicola amphibius]XP_041910742.1 KRAB domain-containing protein 1 isoform X2 [Arvicola amphibius]XP_041910743.1 KRAB domain-containing protein 1 isoform X2 [Arvicola amphibius]XP_041910744.1 KRAB domain-containing protein 1 isoform X2 [Arvicola amphibius]